MSGERPKKILILAAAPKDAARLRLDEEVREIQAGLERARRREQFEIISRWAVRSEDLRRALLDCEPDIVHFSGHGMRTEGLALEDKSGNVKFASGEALAGLFKLFVGKVECVLLNACYSEAQAEAISPYVDYVIGMNQAVGDQAALAFAVGFYDALGAGRLVEEAYAFGCSAIDFESVLERLTPVLKKRTSAAPKSSPVPVPPSPIEPEPIRLETPEGQVPLGSPFYVDRPPIEAECYDTIMKPGALIRVKAARQMGKSSLMMRILAHAQAQGCRSVPVYCQEAEGEIFASLDQFLQWFCATIAEELGLDADVELFWRRGSLGSKRKCTNYMQQVILAAASNPLVLGLDEVDLVFQHLKIAQEFFALLRAWHERGKNDPVWQKLRLVIVHSKEVYIPLDMHQSPFNVGVPIELPEFTLEQVEGLAQCHGLRLSPEQVTELVAMVGGHPYLVRVALYDLARQRRSLAQWLQVAPTQEGPYYDHLRRHLLNLQGNPSLVKAMKQVIAASHPVQIGSDEAFQLRSMGLVKFQGNAVVPLCDLYCQYFRNHLN